MTAEVTVELECCDGEGLFDQPMPEGVWLRVKSGGMCALIDVRGPVEGVVKWVNEVYAGGADVPPVLRPDGSYANAENPGAPEGY